MPNNTGFCFGYAVYLTKHQQNTPLLSLCVALVSSNIVDRHADICLNYPKKRFITKRDKRKMSIWRIFVAVTGPTGGNSKGTERHTPSSVPISFSQVAPYGKLQTMWSKLQLILSFVPVNVSWADGRFLWTSGGTRWSVRAKDRFLS